MSETITCCSCTVDVQVPREVWVYEKDGKEYWEHLEMSENGVKFQNSTFYRDVSGNLVENPRPPIQMVKAVRTIPVSQDRVFDGTWAQAEVAGWVENDFGFVCPDCADFDSGSVEGENIKAVIATVAGADLYNEDVE